MVPVHGEANLRQEQLAPVFGVAGKIGDPAVGRRQELFRHVP